MIKLKNLSKYYANEGTVTLGLRNINLTLKKNEFVAITGDSGSGKSTLLNVICGVDTYDEGEMYFLGNETSYFNQNDLDEYRKNHIGFIYQNYNIIDSYTVLENVMLPMLIHGKTKQEAKEEALQLIEKVGLYERRNNQGTKLSGGEKQRCVIARALASDCEILACDEPTGNLDSATGKEIIRLIKEVAKDKLVLMVTHNYDEVKEYVTRRIKISDGEIVEDYLIQKIEEEAQENVEMLSRPIHKKFLFWTAWNNIKRTPKKTIFSFLVFLCLSLIAFFLYLTCMQSSNTSSYNPDSYFELYANERLIAFNYDHSPIQKNTLDRIGDQRYDNAFYEDSIFKATFINESGKETEAISMIYTKQPIPYTPISGGFPLNDDFYIIFPRHSLDTFSLTYSPYLNTNLKISSGYVRKFVGFGVSDYINTPLLVSNEDLEFLICNIVYRQDIAMNIAVKDLDLSYNCSYIHQNVVEPMIFLPEQLRGHENSFEIEFILKNMYPLIQPEKYLFSYVSYAKDECYFSLPFDYELKADGVYETTVYAAKPNSCIKDLEELGLTVIRPSVENKQFSINLVLFYGYVIISTIVLFVLSFICYAILSRIYISKNKDYTILRSLGVLNKQMNWIVIIEMLIFAIVASIVAFLSFYVLYFSTRFSFLNIVIYNTFGISALYYIAMILFSLFIARRFNKRLFKLSVQTSLKGDVARND